MASIFLIGATGGIGGAVLDGLVKITPSVSITGLVRTSEQGKILETQYPTIKTVVGSLHDEAVLNTELEKADIVVYAGPDYGYEAIIAKILSTLSNRESSTTGQRPFYIQTSGSAIIWEDAPGTFGSKLFDDIEDIETLVGYPDEKIHRAADRVAFAAHEKVNVAIVSPTGVHGTSPSSFHPLPMNTPAVVTAFRNHGSVFTINEGTNELTFVHILDLAQLYVLLVSNAISLLSSPSVTPDPDIWGPKAYFFAGTEIIPFAAWAKAMVPALYPEVISDKEVRPVSFEVAFKASSGEEEPKENTWAFFSTFMLGTNMRIKSSRAEKKLGWKRQQADGIEKTFPESAKTWLALGN